MSTPDTTGATRPTASRFIEWVAEIDPADPDATLTQVVRAARAVREGTVQERQLQHRAWWELTEKGREALAVLDE